MKKKDIRKIQVRYDGEGFKDVNFSYAHLKEFGHPHSKPWEISIETRYKLKKK